MNKLFKITALASVMVLASSVAAMAKDAKVYGKIQSINPQEQSFTIVEDGTGDVWVIMTNPATEIEQGGKRSILSFSDDMLFEDLQTGDWVNVEIQDDMMSRGPKGWTKSNMNMKDSKKAKMNAKMKDGKNRGDMMKGANAPAIVAEEIEVYRY